MFFLKVTPVVLLLFLMSSSTHAATVNKDEKLTAHRWVQKTFAGIHDNTPPKPGLEVLKNRDRVQKNSRYGKPLEIGGVKYARGLFCHAPSKVLVRLPAPAKSLSGVIGVDDGVLFDNHDWPSGPVWPSVVFAVQAGGKDLYRSEKLAGGVPATPIQVDLGGAQEITLCVEKGAYLAWGEADWADAQVTLVDGRVIPLDELVLSNDAIKADSGVVPFSFTYGGKPSGQLLRQWKVERTSRMLDPKRVEHKVVYADPKTGLEVRCMGVEYNDFPTVEWTVYLKNNGKKDTPIIEGLRAVDMRVEKGPTSEFMLRYNRGSSCTYTDYKPFTVQLDARTVKRFAPVTGYSSDPIMPYFNVGLNSGDGVIVAVGWPGQWSAEFERDTDTGLSIRAGQETTHFKLHPGEEVRTPLVALQFYQGGWIHAQNIWRQWMISYGLPHPGGKPISPIMAGSNNDVLNYTGMNEQNQKQFIDLYEQKKIKLNWWWIDYCWYAGNWEPAKDRFPDGLRPVTDYARSKGMNTILWFAPEHSPFGGKPEWIIKGKGVEPLVETGEVSVLNLGNPEALSWLIDMVNKRIDEQGIGCYRHDTAMGPLVCWTANDTPDRQGITENKYVSGFLAFYDGLLAKHPNLLIDNCCRGGRRLDLECMRRSVPLWRTDIFYVPASHQGQTYGLNMWIPFHGTGVFHDNAYAFRSVMSPSTVLSYDVRRDDLNYDLIRRMCDQWWEELSPNFFADYYPLTPYSLDKDVWIAWQYDRPEEGKGIIQVFRREESLMESFYVKLHALEREANYELVDIDTGTTQVLTGKELMTTGACVRIPTRPGAAIIRYGKKHE